MPPLDKQPTNRATVLTCLHLQTWEGQKEREGGRPGRGLSSLLVTCSCESQLAIRALLPTSLLCRPALYTSGPVASVQVQSSTPLLGARGPHLESLLPSVSAVYAMRVPLVPASGSCEDSSPSVWHTLGAQRAKMPPFCVGPPLLSSGQSSSSRMTTHALRGSQGGTRRPLTLHPKKGQRAGARWEPGWLSHGGGPLASGTRQLPCSKTKGPEEKGLKCSWTSNASDERCFDGLDVNKL